MVKSPTFTKDIHRASAWPGGPLPWPSEIPSGPERKTGDPTFKKIPMCSDSFPNGDINTHADS